MCPIPNGFRDRALSMYSSLDLASNIVIPFRVRIYAKRQLAAVTFGSDIIEMLWKMPHIFPLYAVLTRVAKSIDVDHEILKNLLY
jgi:hypothetical protein